MEASPRSLGSERTWTSGAGGHRAPTVPAQGPEGIELVAGSGSIDERGHPWLCVVVWRWPSLSLAVAPWVAAFGASVLLSAVALGALLTHLQTQPVGATPLSGGARRPQGLRWACSLLRSVALGRGCADS